MSYLYNAWYMAAWADEVSDGFLTRTLLDIPVMMYRQDDGRVIAMHDACPHRFAPLSLGKLVDGKVRCGYHGLEFNSDGQCVGSCIGGVAPKAASVRTFPIVEQNDMVWIWMGDSSAADPASILRFPFITDPDARSARGMMTTRADYRLVLDNLMDLTHAALLHPAFGGGIEFQPKFRSWEDGDDVISEYLSETSQSMIGGNSLIEASNVIRWRVPGSHSLLTSVRSGENAFPPFDVPAAHIVTPETKDSSHYFWASVVTDDNMVEALKRAFDDEDKPMLEAVQNRMENRELFDMKPLLLGADASAIRIRRKLDAMIQQERERSETREYT